MAQMAGDHVVRSAEGAFGLSIGNERLGPYTEDNVRGFSPALAGNIRLDSLCGGRLGVDGGRPLVAKMTAASPALGTLLSIPRPRLSFSGGAPKHGGASCGLRAVDVSGL
jgi:hypothetical protein